MNVVDAVMNTTNTKNQILKLLFLLTKTFQISISKILKESLVSQIIIQFIKSTAILKRFVINAARVPRLRTYLF